MLALGAAIGAVLGLFAGWLADVLPGRYEIDLLVSGPARRRRYIALAVLSGLASLGIAHVLAGVHGDATWHLVLLFAVNAAAAALLLAGAAIDLEHLILPNEITFGVTAICLLSSPFRSVGWKMSLAGAVLAVLLTYVPFLLYQRIKGYSGMGLGDLKLAVAAGAWHGPEGLVFVLFAGALQQVLASILLRASGREFAVPASVTAHIAKLRARAADGDEDAAEELADDPLAADAGSKMRLPLGPPLVLAALEALFLRRWLLDEVVPWFFR